MLHSQVENVLDSKYQVRSGLAGESYIRTQVGRTSVSPIFREL